MSQETGKESGNREGVRKQGRNQGTGKESGNREGVRKQGRAQHREFKAHEVLSRKEHAASLHLSRWQNTIQNTTCSTLLRAAPKLGLYWRHLESRLNSIHGSTDDRMQEGAKLVIDTPACSSTTPACSSTTPACSSTTPACSSTTPACSSSTPACSSSTPACSSTVYIKKEENTAQINSPEQERDPRRRKVNYHEKHNKKHKIRQIVKQRERERERERERSRFIMDSHSRRHVFDNYEEGDADLQGNPVKT
ncbi:hypothetical protein FHG87_008909 [Trinorchestia longiramus]|nr:hypothetical protein FHG87_008909 [Trinorchestia longiramus]